MAGIDRKIPHVCRGGLVHRFSSPFMMYWNSWKETMVVRSQNFMSFFTYLVIFTTGLFAGGNLLVIFTLTLRASLFLAACSSSPYSFIGSQRNSYRSFPMNRRCCCRYTWLPTVSISSFLPVINPYIYRLPEFAGTCLFYPLNYAISLTPLSSCINRSL